MTGRCLVVVPAYNEADTIEEVVRRALRHADVCVVDDGSTDATADLVEAVGGVTCIRHDQNTHIAGAIVDGFRHAEANDYSYCITMDAGLSHDPDQIPRFQAVADADLVLGYRENRIDVPLRRRALSRVATLLINRGLARQRNIAETPTFRDTTSGFRMYSRAAYRIILGAELQCRSFDFHLEALSRIAKAGLPIAEVPITYRYTNSSLRLPVLRDALATFGRIWRDELV